MTTPRTPHPAAPARRPDSLETKIERLIGQYVAQALRDGSGVDNDPLLANWVKGVGAKVSAVSPRRDVPYTFTILGTDAANALAAPGGHVFVTRGLLDVVESDDELAVVLAHETAHVAKKHALQQIGENAAFLVALSFLGGKVPPEIRTGVYIANVFRTLARSRGMEAQADEEGLKYAFAAGYDPLGLIHFFEGFDLRKRSLVEEYVATHPSPEKRMAAARRSPLVARPDADARERAARGYEARGLRGAAAVARRGGDPLLPAAAPEPGVPDFLRAERDGVHGRAEKLRKSLGNPNGAQRAGNTLQTILLVNNQGDPRWIFLASRAYAVQTNVEDLLARAQRLAAVAPPTYDALARYGDRSVEDATGRESALGRDEVRRALARAEGTATPLNRAARAVTTVLADLNNRFYRPRGNTAWVRYGSLEALLRYAESELGRADRMSGQAWRLLALARIRRYQVDISGLVPENDADRRALWADLAKRRFGVWFPTVGATGPATVRAALSVELGESPMRLEARRGDRTWADYALEAKGVPENIATVLRLLTLDLERETQNLPTRTS